jgi:hypothetical protein
VLTPPFATEPQPINALGMPQPFVLVAPPPPLPPEPPLPALASGISSDVPPVPPAADPPEPAAGIIIPASAGPVPPRPAELTSPPVVPAIGIPLLDIAGGAAGGVLPADPNGAIAPAVGPAPDGNVVWPLSPLPVAPGLSEHAATIKTTAATATMLIRGFMQLTSIAGLRVAQSPVMRGPTYSITPADPRHVLA